MAGAIRHPIDVKSLEAWIVKNVPEIDVPLDVKQFGFGQSNPTYQLTSPRGAKYVMRKKPPGKLLSASAHQVEREYRVLAALAGTDVPVPRALALCADASVVGTPFYVMSFAAGRILEDPSRPSRAMWLDAARTMGRLHGVDVTEGGQLRGYGRRGGFYARQVATWAGVCAAQARQRDADTGEEVGELPRFGELMAFFGDGARRPVDRAVLVHGDYKIDNLVYHATEPRVVAILDWEMSTIGHPLADLANLIAPFLLARHATSLPPAAVNPGFLPGSMTPGLPTRDEVVDAYWSVADPSPSPSSSTTERERELRWAEAFNTFRSAAIAQGIAARQAARQASSASASRYAALRGPFAELAWRLVRELQAEEGEKARL